MPDWKEAEVVVVDATALRNGLSRLRRAVPKALNNAILLCTNVDGLSLSAQGDMWAEVTIDLPPDTDTDEHKFVIQSPQRLAQVLESYRGEIEIGFGKTLSLKGTMSAYINSSSTPVEFFNISWPQVEWTPMPQEITKILYAAGKKELVQDVVYFIPGGAVCDDGFRVACLRIPNICETPATVRVEMLARSMDSNTEIAFIEGAAMIQSPGFRARLPLDYKKPPDRDHALVNEALPTMHCIAPRHELRSLAIGVAALSEGEVYTGSPIWLFLAGNELWLKAVGNQMGTGSGCIEIQRVGEDFKVGCSAIYLLAALGQAEGPDISIGQFHGAIYIKGTDSSQHFFMPMAIQGGEDEQTL
jgi:hypothetical protein